MTSDAKISDCKKYRYWLLRQWDARQSIVAFIGLNPSTADAQQDDPTIRKCIGYARSWEHGGLLMLNLFSWRATKPADLWAKDDAQQDIVGRQGGTTEHLLNYLVQFGVARVVAAWGKGRQQKRALRVAAALPRLDCLMRNEDGSPAHPLYLTSGLLPEPWNYKA